MAKITIRRRGFRAAPASIEGPAAEVTSAFAQDHGATLAELRPSSYLGPDSPATRGAWMLSLTALEGRGFRLVTIYPETGRIVDGVRGTSRTDADALAVMNSEPLDVQ